MNEDQHLVKDLVRLEAKIGHMDENLSQLLTEIKSLKKEFIERREHDLMTKVRLERLEAEVITMRKDQESIRLSLHGNITSKVLKHWILGASSILTAVAFLAGLFSKILK